MRLTCFVVCLFAILSLPVDVFAQKGPPEDDGSAWVKIPAGGSATMKRRVTDTEDKGGTRDSERAESSGPSALASGSGKLSENVTGSAPDAHTSGGAGAKGGDTKANVTAFAVENLWKDPFLWFGVACLLAAGGCFVVPMLVKPFPLVIAPRYPLVLACAAIGFFAIAVNHSLLYVMLGGIVVVTAGMLLMGHVKDAVAKKKVADEAAVTAHKAAATTSALDEIIEGALTDNPAAHRALLAHLDKRAEPADKALILSRIAESGVKLSPDEPVISVRGLAPGTGATVNVGPNAGTGSVGSNGGAS